VITLLSTIIHASVLIAIGSGVTEAACKTIVKQRLCQSGMKWLELGASFNDKIISHLDFSPLISIASW